MDILNEGVIYGDAEARSTITNLGTIIGTQTVPVPDKAMPAATVVADYIVLATPITYGMVVGGVIDKQVLSPGNNPWGATDPDGVYYIDTLGGDLTIRASRIHGTLIVKCGAGTVRLETAALLHPYRTDYPTLIVDGDLEVLLDSGDIPLSEAQWEISFNPIGTPYEGAADDPQPIWLTIAGFLTFGDVPGACTVYRVIASTSQPAQSDARSRIVDISRGSTD